MPGYELIETPAHFNADSPRAAASRDAASRDAAFHDAASRDAAPHDAAPHDAASRDAASRATPTEPGSRDFSLAFARLQDAAGVRTLQALAELFRVRMSFVSDVKRREKIPATWLYHLLLTRRVSPHWIVFGTGPKELAQADMMDEGVAALLLQQAGTLQR